MTDEDAKLARRIADNVRVARLAAGLTQAELGERCGINSANLSRAERGHKFLSIPVLARIARGLGVPLEQLVREPAAQNGRKRRPPSA